MSKKKHVIYFEKKMMKHVGPSTTSTASYDHTGPSPSKWSMAQKMSTLIYRMSKEGDISTWLNLIKPQRSSQLKCGASLTTSPY